MTDVITWNKGTAPAGTNGWLLLPDVRKALESMNVPVPVATQAERDGITPPLGRYVGMSVLRADLGNLLETWDGSAWVRQAQTGSVTQTDTNWGYNGGLIRHRGVDRTHVTLSLKMNRTAGGGIALGATYLNLGSFIPNGWYPVVGAFGTVNVHTSGSAFRFQALVNVSVTGDILMQLPSGSQTLNVGDFFVIDLGWHS